MSDILIKNAFLLTMDDRRRYFDDGAVAIDGNRITAVGETAQVTKDFSGDRVIDAKNMVVMPGLINGHDHYEQTFFKGLTRLFLDTTYAWVKEFKIPLTREMNPDDYYYSSLLACIEMIKTGTTCAVNSVCQQDPNKIRGFGIDKIAKAIVDSGTRSVIAVGSSDKFEPADFLVSPEEGVGLAEEAIRRWHKKADGRIRVWAGPAGTFSVSRQMFSAFKDLAGKYDVGVHTHLASAARGEAKKAYDSGLLGSNVSAAHCVWLDDEEISYLAQTETKAVHCPTYKLGYSIDSSVERFGDGIAPIVDMMKAGITVGLGTDGCMGNTHDMFKEMRCLASTQHYKMVDKTLLPPTKLLEMVTRDCAKTLLWDDEVGSIAVGKRADIVLIDIKKPHMVPWTNPPASLVYLTSGFDVDTVIIDGRIVMDHREIETIDEREAIEKAQQLAEGLIERAGFRPLVEKGFKPWCSDISFTKSR